MIYHGDYDSRSGKSKAGTLDDLEKTVRAVCKTLRAEGLHKFDSIAVQGVSGMCVGFPVALRLKKPIVIVRKPDEDSHGRPVVNNTRIGKRVLFLDDFVCGGETRERCRLGVEKNGAKIVGTYEYDKHEVDWRAAPEF